MLSEKYVCHQISTSCCPVWLLYCGRMFLPLRWMHLYLSTLTFVFIPLLSLEMGHGQRMAVLPTYSNRETTEGEQRPRGTQRGLCHFPFAHTYAHTHTQCQDKAEAAMVQHASFTLHLLWSTEKTQTIVCVTQYGPLSISSTPSTSLPPSLCPSLPLLCPSLSLLHCTSLPVQLGKKVLPKHTLKFPP